MKHLRFKKTQTCVLATLMALLPCAVNAQRNVEAAIDHYVSTSDIKIVNPVESTQRDMKTGKLTSLYAEYNIDMKKSKGAKFIEKMRRAFQADAAETNCYNMLSLMAGRTNSEKIRVAYGEKMEKSIYFGSHLDRNYLVLLTKEPSDTLRRYCHALVWYEKGSRVKGGIYKIYGLDPANKKNNMYEMFGKNLNFDMGDFNKKMKAGGKVLEKVKDLNLDELFDGDFDSIDFSDTYREVTKKDKDGNIVKVIGYKPDGTVTTVTFNNDGTKCVTVSDSTGTYHTNGYKSNGDSVSVKSNVDGSYCKYVKSKNGATTFYKYNNDGSYVKNERKADGSRLYIKYNSDGSYVKDERRADGSRLYIKYNSDGSYLKDEKNADGSSLLKRKKSDGSYFEEEKDKNGRVVYTKKKPYTSRGNNNDISSDRDALSEEIIGGKTIFSQQRLM